MRELGNPSYGKGERANATLPRNNLMGESGSCPYRNPTQVDKEKILRRSSEPSLRNSAKWPRNFGRRGALLREAHSGARESFNKEAHVTV